MSDGATDAYYREQRVSKRKKEVMKEKIMDKFDDLIEDLRKWMASMEEE